MDNETNTNLLVDPTAIAAIGTELQSNIRGIAPAIFGVMAVTIVATLIFKFVRRNVSK